MCDTETFLPTSLYYSLLHALGMTSRTGQCLSYHSFLSEQWSKCVNEVDLSITGIKYHWHLVANNKMEICPQKEWCWHFREDGLIGYCGFGGGDLYSHRMKHWSSLFQVTRSQPSSWSISSVHNLVVSMHICTHTRTHSQTRVCFIILLRTLYWLYDQCS